MIHGLVEWLSENEVGEEGGKVVHCGVVEPLKGEVGDAGREYVKITRGRGEIRRRAVKRSIVTRR
jgi:hypothetical protein